MCHSSISFSQVIGYCYILLFTLKNLPWRLSHISAWRPVLFLVTATEDSISFFNVIYLMQTLLATSTGLSGLACDSQVGVHTGVYAPTNTDTYLKVGGGSSLNLDLMKETRGLRGMSDTGAGRRRHTFSCRVITSGCDQTSVDSVFSHPVKLGSAL